MARSYPPARLLLFALLLLLVACGGGQPETALPSDTDMAEAIADPDALYSQGLALIGQNNPAAAIASFDAAIEMRPDFAPAHNQRGYAYALLGDLERASVEYERAIELQPDFAEAYHNRGVARLSQGEIQQALTDFDRAIELNGDFADAYYNRGNAYYVLGDRASALADFQRHLALAPPSEATTLLEQWVTELEQEVAAP